MITPQWQANIDAIDAQADQVGYSKAELDARHDNNCRRIAELLLPVVMPAWVAAENRRVGLEG